MLSVVSYNSTFLVSILVFFFLCCLVPVKVDQKYYMYVRWSWEMHTFQWSVCIHFARCEAPPTTPFWTIVWPYVNWIEFQYSIMVFWADIFGTEVIFWSGQFNGILQHKQDSGYAKIGNFIWCAFSWRMLIIFENIRSIRKICNCNFQDVNNLFFFLEKHIQDHE